MTLIQTKSLSKTEQILKFRKSHTLAETGKKFNLTSERVRQIEMTKHRKRCKIHDRFYYNKCSHCFATSYKRMIHLMEDKDIDKEVEKEAINRKRDYLSTQRKVYLVALLRSRYDYSYTQIARMLRRDRSTIINLANQINGI